MKKHQKVLVLLLGGLFFTGISSAVFSQVVPGQPIKGTIAVQEGQRLNGLAKITSEQARAAAEKAVPGASFKDSDLEEEDGYLVYEIELREDRREVEVYVDAGDGSVLLIDRDDD